MGSKTAVEDTRAGTCTAEHRKAELLESDEGNETVDGRLITLHEDNTTDGTGGRLVVGDAVRLPPMSCPTPDMSTIQDEDEDQVGGVEELLEALQDGVVDALESRMTVPDLDSIDELD